MSAAYAEIPSPFLGIVSAISPFDTEHVPHDFSAGSGVEPA
jgi:hypothetical protein